MISSSIVQNQCINLSFASLLTATLTYWIRTVFKLAPRKYSFAFFMICISNVCLGIMLSLRWFTAGYFPLSNLYESLVFLTWGITAIHLLIEYKTGSFLIGAIAAPVAMFTIAFASLALPVDMKQAAPLVPALKSNWLMMHVSVMMLSYSTLILGSLLSILFLVLSKGQDVKLQGSSTGNTYGVNKQGAISSETDTLTHGNLGLLGSIDNLSYRIIGLGFPLLTVGIIAGAIWADRAWGSYWSWDPKETWALITWLIFAAYLHARLTKSWQGKKPALLASIGFVVVWICYLGVNFLGKGLHSYGWFA
uniref:cytochrome c biogenesis protein n=1 Tax=Timspurckia oligopyrenoides TaxID=708627 RepID=UPI001FCD957F|nr:cytochrome c biogenesis protein [Timspurckia oligopyrenoides]UNJ17487.1 cytochrome c biogenesis protein [Timspurckia oligopyrenoides]